MFYYNPIMKKFAIIIPTYMEKENLTHLLPLLVKLYPSAFIIVVDDASNDTTFSFVQQFSAKHPQLFLLSRKKKLGRGSAVLAGFQKAQKIGKIDYFLEMDADFSHDPQEISSLLAKANPRTVIIGSRYLPGSRIINWPKTRKVLSLLANLYTRLILQIPINDYTNGFRLYPKEAIKVILESLIREKGYAALSEIAFLLYKRGFSFVEVPTTFVNRQRGKSNTNLGEYLQSLTAIIKIRLKG